MDKSKKDVTVTITTAENGIVVECCYGSRMEHDDKQYIYKTIEQVAKELPGIYSVAEAEAPESTEKDLDEMKKKIGSYE